MARSNSATAPKTWKIIRPPGVVVSRPRWGVEFDAAVLEVAGDGEQAWERSAEAVEPPHHEHVTAAGVVEQHGQLGVVVASTGYVLRPNRSAPASVSAFACMSGDWCSVEPRVYPSSITGRFSLVDVSTGFGPNRDAWGPGGSHLCL